MEKATLGAGCFWCIEAVFQKLDGVNDVVSGYMGGSAPNPTYQQVCTGATGHAEVVQLTFDPEVIGYQQILQVFWHTHDPTTLNRQGNDVGTQYRSAVFYHNQQQKEIAEELKQSLDAQKIWDQPIVTEIVPADTFYAAENYHQNYFNSNSQQPYCQLVINPKLKKFKEQYSGMLKSTS